MFIISKPPRMENFASSSSTTGGPAGADPGSSGQSSAGSDEDDEAARRANRSEGGSGINEYVASLFDQSLDWDDFRWLCGLTRLPVVAKGVLTAEDADLALAAGASAVWVSNHGARQLDTVPASVRAAACNLLSC